MPRGEQRTELPGGTSSVRLARRATTDALTAWGLEHLCDDATLLTSELVTNVVLHVGTPSVLVLHRTPRGLRIEVHDDDPALPVAKDYGTDATTGRGLGLVATFSSEWGVARTSDGKVVWAELGDEHPGSARDGEAATASMAEVDDLDRLEAALLGLDRGKEEP